MLTALHVAEAVCSPVAHRQVVLTIPKRLRLHTRFDRKLLGRLCACAWTCIRAEVQRALGRPDVLPGMVAAIQTHGELLHWHPHVHALVTCGAFTPEGDFLPVPEFDVERLCADWQEAVFALYLAQGKIEPEVVENMRAWPHSGFSVDQSVLLPAHDRAGIERLVQYMTRCPLSLSRLGKVTKTGQVIYKAEKDACRAFPDPQGDGLKSGPRRNFQILAPLDFLAEFTQHIPPTGAHLIRYYGWYSNKSRGMRRKTAAEAAAAEPPGGTSLNAVKGVACAPTDPPARRCSQTWAMLIKRVYEVDALACPKCGGQMKVIAFIEPRAPERSDGRGDVIEKILRHCGLWNPATPRPPPAEDYPDWVYVPDDPDGEAARQAASSDEPGEVTFVDIDTFEATF